LQDGVWSDVLKQRTWGFSALAAIAAIHAADTTIGRSGRDWPIYGGNSASTRYSSLKQINRSNAAQLRVAWTHYTADGPGASQTQPIVVGGVVYGLSLHRSDKF
jgi:glucose dehydrogenase